MAAVLFPVVMEAVIAVVPHTAEGARNILFLAPGTVPDWPEVGHILAMVVDAHLGFVLALTDPGSVTTSCPDGINPRLSVPAS